MLSYVNLIHISNLIVYISIVYIYQIIMLNKVNLLNIENW